MSFTLLTDKLIELKVSEIPIGEGAEGIIYEVLEPLDWQGYVVKVYKDQIKTKPRQAKIEYLIKHRPSLKNPFSVIFPEAIIYEYGQFAGFLMKKACGTYDLTSLCTLGHSHRLPREWHDKYNRDTRQGMRNRLKVCYNIAAAFQQVHQLGNFSFVDIKPENIKINYEGQVSIVDVDSMAIIDGEDLIYPAEKITHEYSPSERTEIDLYKDPISETWDRFSIAVLFYKVLFGIHPYAGTCNDPYAQHTSNEQKIAEGLFPHGEKANFFSIIPEPHARFNEAPKSVRKLFFHCFEIGHNIPWQRPSAADWCKVLKKSKPQKSLVKSWKEFKLIPSFSKSKALAVPSSRPKKRKRSSLVTIGQGTVPALVVMGAMVTSSFGIMQYNHYYEMQQLAATYNDLGQKAKLSPYQQKMLHVQKYEFVSSYRDGIATVLSNGKWGYINAEGESLTPIKYDDASFKFYDGHAIVKVGHQYGYVNTKGREITDIQFDWAERFHEGMALVDKNAQYYFINHQGSEMFRLDCDVIGVFREGLAAFQKDGSWGFLNAYGQEIISPIYEAAYPFSDGLAVVKYQGKYGYINYLGDVVIPIEYDAAYSFGNGEASVLVNGLRWIINKQGELIRLEN